MIIDNLPKAKQNAYLKKHIANDSQLRRYFPRKYIDYRKFSTLKEMDFSTGKVRAAVVGQLVNIQKKTGSSGKSFVSIKAQDAQGIPFRVMFMNASYLFKRLSPYVGMALAFMGDFAFDPTYGYSVTNPEYSNNTTSAPGIVSVYGKIKGIPDKTLREHIDCCLWEGETDSLPYSVAKQFPLMPDIRTALWQIHHPSDEKSLQNAQHRLLLDDLAYLKAALKASGKRKETDVKFTSDEKMTEMIGSLPYPLTGDQKRTIEEFRSQTSQGITVHALIQGDVGCGKTIIAFSLMRCAAENGYQSILMAPTRILAGQHYEVLKELVPEDEIAFYDGTVPASKKKQYAKEIKDRSVKYIIGTSALLTAGFDLTGIGLSIADEEHRFGVEQRNGIFPEKAHTIIMSATPIPRSMARAVYGDFIQVYQIKDKPAGRKETLTYYDNGSNIERFLLRVLQDGNQAYVVCPLREESEETDLSSVEAVTEKYSEILAPYGYKVGCVTGELAAEKKDEAIAAFKENKIQVLVSTTVIEVGVNVPNANIMIIQDADRFGLSTLHQLRGRVGRGNGQGYCVLVTEKKNKRIEVMCSTTDGFRIAESDLLERKSGDLLGLKQSGRNFLVEEMLANPQMSELADHLISQMSETELLVHTDKYDAIYPSYEDE